MNRNERKLAAQVQHLENKIDYYREAANMHVYYSLLISLDEEKRLKESYQELAEARQKEIKQLKRTIKEYVENRINTI